MSQGNIRERRMVLFNLNNARSCVISRYLTSVDDKVAAHVYLKPIKERATHSSAQPMQVLRPRDSTSRPGPIFMPNIPLVNVGKL